MLPERPKSTRQYICPRQNTYEIKSQKTCRYILGISRRIIEQSYVGVFLVSSLMKDSKLKAVICYVLVKTSARNYYN